MNIFQILLSQESNLEEKNQVIIKLIDEYHFPFDEKTLCNCFKLLNFSRQIRNEEKDCIDLFNKLLYENKDCLIAILKCFEHDNFSGLCLYNVILKLYKTCNHSSFPVVTIDKNVIKSIVWINWLPTPGNCIICWSQKFYLFDVDNIPIQENHKQSVRKYQQQICTSTKNIKPAIRK